MNGGIKMIFIIDGEIYNKTHYSSYEPLKDIRFYFDYTNYNLWDVTDIENPEGMVPFIRIREVDVMKAFVISLNNKQLLSKFNSIPDKEIWEQFWKYFDDDSIKSERWSEFDRNYRIEFIVKWCKENGIAYKLDL